MTSPTLSPIPVDVQRQIDRIEPLPLAARQIMARLRDEDVSAKALTEVIEFDQALAATVMREASRMKFSINRPPETVHEAIQRLGTTALFNLVVGHHLDGLRCTMPTYGLDVEDQWAHSAASRLAVRALASERPELHLPAVAETAALMHDIGKLAISQCFGVAASDLAALAASTGVTFVEAEEQLFGVDHASVGASIASKWDLSPRIVNAIRFHHRPDPAGCDVVCDAVALGNVAAKTVASGLGAEGLNLRVDVQMFRRLGLDFSAFGRICLNVMHELVELRATRGMR